MATLLRTKLATVVVYFNQRMHACACVRMVENDRKLSKIMKKVPFLSCVREAHVRLMKKNEEKITKFQMSNQLFGVTPNC